ncbi:hypothetical protein ACJMK2_034613 [Sinanodonta woodiana]|uniref:SAM domain-containing protein n=1 Tax=Sinanodonta woodiana TaxID=1069815 RepID=A0ABD3WWA1_SINWO
MDNELHTALELAVIHNREDIARFLDNAQAMQQSKNPKVVQSLKEKALKDADRNAKNYEKLQDKVAKEAEKERRRFEKQGQGTIRQNGDVDSVTKMSTFKKLTLRLKNGTTKSKTSLGTNHHFSHLAQGTKKGGAARKILQKMSSNDSHSVMEFKVSETDPSGKRTLKSVNGLGIPKNGQVLYMTNREAENTGSRPALANVFPESSISRKGRWKSESDLLDSGIDSFGSGAQMEDDDEKAGIFCRPEFGKISFLNKFSSTGAFLVPIEVDVEDADSGTLNGDNEIDNTVKRRHSTKSDSIGSTGSLQERMKDLPWKAEDVENLDDDDEEETILTPTLLFLECCGLSHYTHLFAQAEVDMEALLLLNDKDLTEMGLPLGPRRKLTEAINRRKEVLAQKFAMADTML